MKKHHSILSIAAAVAVTFFAGHACAADNNVYIDQPIGPAGGVKWLGMSQSGSGNEIGSASAPTTVSELTSGAINQTGVRNSIKNISTTYYYGSIGVDQNGYNNQITKLKLDFARNSAGIQQKGTQNISSLDFGGYMSSASIDQKGYNNNATLSTSNYSRSDGSVSQSGTQNSANVNLSGFYNSANVSQSGYKQSATVSQGGQYNALNVKQH